MSIEVMKQALAALETCDLDYDYEENPYTTYDEEAVYEAITALRQAIQEAALQKLTDIHQEMEQKPVAWWNPDESAVSFKKLRGDWQPLYAAPVHAIDTLEKHVDETAKDGHEPDVYGDGNVYRGQRSKDSETKTLHLLREENAKLWGWVNELSQKRNPTTPPKREWQGLTDEEIFDVIRSLCADNETAEMLIHVSMDEYRAIEAKLKEKNN